MAYKPGGALSFLESYRDFEGANPSGTRRFAPLTLAHSRSYAMAGIVIFAEIQRRFRGAVEGSWEDRAGLHSRFP